MMNSRLTFVVIATVILVVTAGCTYPEASENTVEFSGYTEWTDNQFQMAGEVHIDGTNDWNTADLTIVLYDDEQSVIERLPVGSLSSRPDGPHPTQRHVNITMDRRPMYVVIESPDLWDEGITSEAFRWNGERYIGYWVESEDERFPSS